jgi:hypothetical protein
MTTASELYTPLRETIARAYDLTDEQADALGLDTPLSDLDPEDHLAALDLELTLGRDFRMPPTEANPDRTLRELAVAAARCLGQAWPVVG